MPIVVHTSTIRIKQSNAFCWLSLRVDHFIKVLDCSDETSPTPTKMALNSNLLVTLHPEFVLSVTGQVGKSKADVEHVMGSACLKLLVDQLKENKSILGIQNVSRPFNDGDVVKVAIDSSSPFAAPSPHSGYPSLELVEMRLGLEWKRPKGGNPESTLHDEDSPFSQQVMLLPHRQAWAQAMDKFMSAHLLRRYPSIFGAWKKDFDAANALCPSIAQSLCNMFSRSENQEFKDNGREMFVKLQESNQRGREHQWSLLDTIIDSSGMPCIPTELIEERKAAAFTAIDELESNADPETIFKSTVCESMANLYKQKVKASAKDFRVISHDNDRNATSIGGAVDERELDAAFGQSASTEFSMEDDLSSIDDAAQLDVDSPPEEVRSSTPPMSSPTNSLVQKPDSFDSSEEWAYSDIDDATYPMGDDGDDFPAIDGFQRVDDQLSQAEPSPSQPISISTSGSQSCPGSDLSDGLASPYGCMLLSPPTSPTNMSSPYFENPVCFEDDPYRYTSLSPTAHAMDMNYSPDCLTPLEDCMVEI